MGLNIQKFKFSEMFNDVNGQTSAAIFLAVVGGIVSVLTFGIAGIVITFVDRTATAGGILTTIMMQSVGLFTVCASLLGIRRFTKTQAISDGATDNDTVN